MSLRKTAFYALASEGTRRELLQVKAALDDAIHNLPRRHAIEKDGSGKMILFVNISFEPSDETLTALKKCYVNDAHGWRDIQHAKMACHQLKFYEA
ncbi:MAG: hypothetical protein ACD_8C00048G0002 [uncultured bacterium]|nr:MAG: hypothetical protein ACD_8C00048G0002 [uncultured bacterium]